MLTRKGKKFKAVTASDAFNFQTKLNAALDELNKKGISYDLQFNNTMGFCAYIVYEEIIEVCETVRDEYEEVGELHTCIECPFFVRPTDGRRKYTRCPKTNKLTAGTGRCCEVFYELLDAGKIDPIQIG